MSELSFNSYLKINAFLTVTRKADVEIDDVPTGFQAEYTWNENGRSFRVTLTGTLTTLESMDSDYDDLMVEATEAPTTDWILFKVREHSARR